MVMRNYPTYRIEDFYTKSFREGGLTYQQFLFLHKSADDALYNQNRFMAAIHGIDIEEPAGMGKNKSVVGSRQMKVGLTGKNPPMLFGDPDQYSHLSDQERKELTQDMLKHWKPLGSKLEPKKPKYQPN